ncbi:hypothetical protein FACS189499_06780 [Clostridia bacterium]|nr:hypothetical protein FACS189499_06780 [Clostridia bacterium]
MKYTLMNVIWETTHGCNLRCSHCGSSCDDSLPDELNAEESLCLAEQITELNPQLITLTGGEPLLRNDWPQVVARLQEKSNEDCVIQMITNGTLVTTDIAKRMKECGLKYVTISIDGLQEQHDYTRGNGVFQKCCDAIAILQEQGITVGVNTTLTKENIGDLPELKQLLIGFGVLRWQLQTAAPMGNFVKRINSMLEPNTFKNIIDFAYDVNKEGKITILLTEEIGYYSRKEAIARQMDLKTSLLPVWRGCNSGIKSVGILANGDIIGCNSIRDKSFVEGNIRERSVSEIWNDENSFSWRRKLKKEMLSGFCKTCMYGDVCLGGCSNVRLTREGGLYSDNHYCLYRCSVNK